MSMPKESDEMKQVRTLIRRDPFFLNVLLETKPLLIDFPFRKNVLVRMRDIAAIVRDPGYQNFSAAGILVSLLVKSFRPVMGLQEAT